MAIDRKNFIDKQISSPKNIPESSIINTAQESSIVNTLQESSIVNTLQESSIVNASQESSIVNSSQESSIVNSNQESSIINTGQESSIVNVGQESSIVNQGQESSIVNTSQESSIVNQGQESSIVNTSQESSIVNNNQESSIVNNMPRNVVSVLNFESFGHNTSIEGSIGGVAISGGSDTHSKEGRLSATNIIDLVEEDGYGSAETMSVYSYDKEFGHIVVYGNRYLGTNALLNVETIEIKVSNPASGSTATFDILQGPLTVPWKVYKEETTVEGEHDYFLSVGPVFIPVVTASMLNAQWRSPAITVNGDIIIKRCVLSYGNYQMDREADYFNNSIAAAYDRGGSPLQGLRIKDFDDGSLGGSLEVKVQYHNDKQEYLNNISSNTITISGTNNTSIVSSSKRFFSLQIVYITSEGARKFPRFRNIDHYDGRNGVLTGATIGLRQVHGVADYYGSVKSFTMEKGSFPDGVGFKFTTTYGGEAEFYSGDRNLQAEERYLRNLQAVDVTESSSLKDPLMQIRPSNTGWSPGVTFTEIDVYSVVNRSNTEYTYISIDINNISSTKLASEAQPGKVVIGAIGLGTITGINGGNYNSKQYIIEDPTVGKDTGDVTFGSSAPWYKNIYKLSERYFLTYATSRIQISGIVQRYFGMYDAIDNRHFSPKNILDNIDYTLPVLSSLFIESVNIITDNKHELGVVVKYNGITENSLTAYLTICRAASFNGARLVKSDSYKKNKVLEIIPITEEDLSFTDNTYSFGERLQGGTPRFKERGVTKDFGIICGNTDIAYEKNAESSNLNLNSGFSALIHAKRYMNKNTAIVRDSSLFAMFAISFPLYTPQASIIPLDGDVVDDSVTWIDETDGMNYETDIGSILNMLKRMMGYNWKSDGDVGTFYNGATLAPQTGTMIIAKTPSVNDQGDYNVLPSRIDDVIGVDISIDPLRIGTSYLSVGGLGLTEENGFLYPSSSYKLVPKNVKNFLSTNGIIHSHGNIITVTTDTSTHLYAMDRSGNANYMLSIPDRIISNTVTVGAALIMLGTTGIYKFSEGTYSKIYETEVVMEYASIKALEGKFYVAAFKDVDGSFAFYGISPVLGISRLEHNQSMDDYLVIDSSRSVTDKLVLISTNTSVATKVVGEGSLHSQHGTVSRPLSIVSKEGLVFKADRIQIYTYGEGPFGFTIGNTGYGINEGYGCIGYNYPCTDGIYPVLNGLTIEASPLLSRLQRTKIEIEETLIDYTTIGFVLGNGISLDKVELVGTYVRD